MPKYQWDSGTIAQAESITNVPGKVEVILRPQKNATAHDLTALRQELGRNGLVNYVDQDAQGDRLIIPVIKNEKLLIGTLEKGGWVKGVPSMTYTSEDKEIHHDSAREKMQKHSLLLSALFYDLGNVACMVSGWQRGKLNRGGKFTAADWSEMGVGVAFTAGDLLLTVFGKEEKKDPLLAFSDEMKNYLSAHDVVVPQGVGATPEAIHKSGVLSTAHDFLKRNVTSIKCLSETTGGALMIKAGLKPGNVNNGKVAAGLMLTTGWLSTFFLDKPNAPPYSFKPEVDVGSQNTGQKLVGWLKDNPRGRIAMPLGMANNVSNLYGSWKESKKFAGDVAMARRSGNAAEIAYNTAKQNDYVWNVLSACSFLIGHSFFGMSGQKPSDSHVADTRTFTHDVLAVSANMLCSVPQEARQLAVEAAAEYIVSIKDVALRKEDAARLINERIDHLKKSPFVTGDASGISR
ncbi:MAG: hypothetical protein K2Q01_00315 [Rickettsiales bacterium]|nr:hypothetical protein [Rickettsiales bacterium]